MKKIEVVISPFRLDDVKDELVRSGIDAMTVSEITGSNGHDHEVRMYRGTPYAIDFHPRVKIELAVADDQVLTAVEVLERAAQGDRAGDGAILVMPIEDVVRIRTGEHGVAAVHSSAHVVRETPATSPLHFTTMLARA
jgi:nitrogen regulatory protein P-II 1